jgi:hypothetical protein
VDVATDPATGEITGTVPMVGACRWRKDGRLLATPTMAFSGEQAGPLDLVFAPAGAGASPQRAVMAEALADPAGRNACCD